MEPIASTEMSKIENSQNEKSQELYELSNSEIISIIKEKNKFKVLNIYNSLEIKEVYILIYHKLFNPLTNHFDTAFDGTSLDNYFEFTYKNKKKYSFFENLLEIFPINDDTIKLISITNLKKMILEIIGIDKAQNLLKMIPFQSLISTSFSDDKDFLMELYFKSGCISTLPTFLLVDKLIEDKSFVNSSQKSILSAACRNSDIRILKYIMENFNDYHKPSWSSLQFIKVLISQIYSQHIPEKYALRRLKILNSKINLIPYFGDMINYCYSIEMLVTLSKYYLGDYKLTYQNIQYIVGSFFDPMENLDNPKDDIKNDLLKLLNIFDNKSNVMIMMAVFLNSRELYGIDLKEYASKCSDEELSEVGGKYITPITNDIFRNGNNNHNHFSKLISSWNVKDLKVVFNIWEPNIQDSWYITRNSGAFIFILPFVNYFHYNKDLNDISEKYFLIKGKNSMSPVSLNYLKLKFKVMLRKNNKVIQLKNKLQIFRELKEPEEDRLQKFSKVPPRHILPFEISTLKETSDGLYLIREKADGCLVDFISKDVEPVIPEYFSNSIKAEFIEELDLYLIFDINIENTGYIPRYDYLRRLHPSTSDSLLDTTEVIKDFDTLKKEILKERKRFSEFLKLPYKNYRIYPKASWIVDSLDYSINQELIENIINEKDCEFICNEGEYLNDGLIISPFDGSRELKIKPKSMHTIDLKFDGEKWLDREENCWNQFIKSDGLFTKDTIWRCYPIENGIFEPREFRYDKTKANKNSVVRMIFNLCQIDWNCLKANGSNFFYQLSNNLKITNWKKIKNIQNKHLGHFLEVLNPNSKSSWLDLGCGSSKLLKFIKGYNPHKYVGLDFDIHQLIKAIKRIESKFSNIRECEVIPFDLKTWNKHDLAWSSFDSNKKFDYIVANFSLPHFNTDIFWSSLESVCSEKTVFIFNVVNSNSMKKWESEDSYLYCDFDKIKYRFSEIHSEEMVEDYLSDSKISGLAKKYNWNLTEKFTPEGYNLDSKYSWYIFKK